MQLRVLMAAVTMLTLSGCGSGRAGSAPDAGPSVPGTATTELVRLFAAGELDPARMECVVSASVSVAQETQLRLRQMREAEARVVAGAARDHARSVQAGMISAEIQDAAAQAAQETQRTVEYFRSTGQLTRAATQASYGMSVQQYARSRADIRVHGPTDDRIWSEREAELLVEYAALRSVRAGVADPAPEIVRRLAEIDAEEPEIVNEYSAMITALYFDPELPCAVGVR